MGFELSKVVMLCSGLISRNLLSGLKTCIELSSDMFDDKAGMPREAVCMSSSFSEDKKKLDANVMVCVILLPFLFILSDCWVRKLSCSLLCAYASLFFLKDLKLATFSNYPVLV